MIPLSILPISLSAISPRKEELRIATRSNRPEEEREKAVPSLGRSRPSGPMLCRSCSLTCGSRSRRPVAGASIGRISRRVARQRDRVRTTSHATTRLSRFSFAFLKLFSSLSIQKHAGRLMHRSYDLSGPSVFSQTAPWIWAFQRESSENSFWGGTPILSFLNVLSFPSPSHAMPSTTAFLDPADFLSPSSALDELKKYTRGDGLSASELVSSFPSFLPSLPPSLPPFASPATCLLFSFSSLLQMDSQKNGGLTYNDILMLPGHINFNVRSSLTFPSRPFSPHLRAHPIRVSLFLCFCRPTRSPLIPCESSRTSFLPNQSELKLINFSPSLPSRPPALPSEFSSRLLSSPPPWTPSPRLSMFPSLIPSYISSKAFANLLFRSRRMAIAIGVSSRSFLPSFLPSLTSPFISSSSSEDSE